MAGRLEGKVALVTGASSGIGEAIADVLAAEGASVAVGARRADRLAAVAERLTSTATQCLALDLDVTDEQSCRVAVDRTVETLGGLDVVVNNAGVMLLGPIVGADTTDWRRMMETNVMGLMYVTHAAIDHLVAQESGDIVQVSSVAGRVARRGTGVYNASKWAVNAFSESLRQEVTAKGVRVTVIEPGAVATELPDHITHDSTRQSIKQWIAAMRPLQAADIAAGVLYAVTQPTHVSVNELLIRPTDQDR